MFKTVRKWCQTLHGPTIHSVSDKLNKLLSPRGRTRAEVDKEALKGFLRADVFPLLEGQSYDTALQSELIKRDLCLLCRESAYSAAILTANPDGHFVQLLLNFIRHDEERMDCLKRLTSTQASKIIEYLTFLHVEGADDVFAILVSRVNFKNLQNLARVMFCFSERGYTDLNVTVVVPAYGGEKWLPEPIGEGRYHPAPEAVRILRALSKSIRMYIESHYPRATLEASLGNDLKFPLSSFHLFRNHLIEFILANPEEMRGAHWVNLSRALLNFPPVVQTLPGMNGNSAELMETLCLHRSTGKGKSRSAQQITCTDVAELAVAKVFEHVQNVESGTVTSTFASRGEGEPQEEEGVYDHKSTKSLVGGTTESTMDKPARDTKYLSNVRDAFDCNPADLLKLLRQLVALPTSPVNNARIEKLVNALVKGAPDLSFSNIVKLLTLVRSLSSFPTISATAPALARIAGEKLLERPVKDVLRREEFSDLVQLAIIVYACRLRDVPGYLEFLRRAAVHISPRELTLDYVVAFLNSLSILKIRKSDGDITLNLTNKVIENTAPFHPLLATHPEQSVKLLRAFVMQNITPTVFFMKGVFGEKGVAVLEEGSPLSAAGAVTLFDVSRSLAYVVKHSREVSRPDLEQCAWDLGIRGTVLPLLHQWNEVMRVTPARKDYVPLSWRCVLETLALFLDVLLDHHSLTVLTERFTVIYDVLKDVMRSAAICAGKQIDALMSLTPEAREDRLPRIAFKNNTMIHFTSALLSFEYYLFHAAWQETQEHRRILREQEGGVKNGKKEECEFKGPLQKLKEDYLENFLHKPCQGSSSGVSYTPKQILHKVFYDSYSLSTSSSSRDLADHPQQVSDECKQSSEENGPPLLSREQTLEITTHLPFAISLVIEPGPVNEYFMEKSYPTMVAGLTSDA